MLTMNAFDGFRPRLQVSALAAMANPSYRRHDTWNLLDDACRHLAALDRAGRPTAAAVAAVDELLGQLSAYERYWLFPGAARLATYRAYLDDMKTEHLATEVTHAVRLIADFGDNAPSFDDTTPLAGLDLPTEAQPQQRCYTVLLADDSESLRHNISEHLYELQHRSADVQYRLLIVPSVEDAICAVALNGAIQAAIIRHDLPLRSSQRLPLMDTLLGEQADDGDPERTSDWIECGAWIRTLRPHIDLYLLTDETIASATEEEPGIYDRTFYRLNDATDLHSTICAGINKRFATPFFDALRTYAAAPVGQFHALPVARGASIFNSLSLHDMGEFYGRNVFMAETSSTSGGLDSLLDPHGAIRRAMDKAAKTWQAHETFFVTNGTSTANKIVVQSLVRPGDIVLIDRNCHKSLRILDEADLVPETHRPSRVSAYRRDRDGVLADWNEAWSSDEFVLDATRVTLYTGATGMNGYDFREKILMDRFGIQINKTSINSVLLIFTIGVTWSSVQYLVHALRRVANDFEREEAIAGKARRALRQRHVQEITEDLPPLPDFSSFADAFKPDPTSNHGDIRAAFYAGYAEADREYVLLGEASRRLAEGTTLVSATFVVPYPPGFPVLVPGQVVSKKILYFLAQLDVKEIHGYNPELGLSLFTDDAIGRIEQARRVGTSER